MDVGASDLSYWCIFIQSVVVRCVLVHMKKEYITVQQNTDKWITSRPGKLI